MVAACAAAMLAASGRLTAADPPLLLITLGDSLTQGTMDARVTAASTLAAYAERVANALEQVTSLAFSQPLYDEAGGRLEPFQIPTNLGVDGSDSFSLEGIEYYKRVGVAESFYTDSLRADALLPRQFDSDYDRVIYPLNLGMPHASQLDAAIKLLNLRNARRPPRTVVLLWIGANDASTAALGSGGAAPMVQPIPLDVIGEELAPELTGLLQGLERRGVVSFEPYTFAAIERNLTDAGDFYAQYTSILRRLRDEVSPRSGPFDLFLLTVPYYSSIGYLFDSEDLEYYLRKVNPSYSVPPTFARVAPDGAAIEDATRGDRISLLTFGFMYALLLTGHSVEEANAILERDGEQRDGLVLSEAEQAFIRDRIDSFNGSIEALAPHAGTHVRVLDVGQYLNDALTGRTPPVVGGRTLSRKWIRGGGFSFDGVHPGHTGNALIANFLVGRLNEALGLQAPLEDLAQVLAEDPYIDHDGDGWAPGPPTPGTGFTELLYLFKDPDDGDPAAGPAVGADIWERISEILIDEFLIVEQN